MKKCKNSIYKIETIFSRFPFIIKGKKEVLLKILCIPLVRQLLVFPYPLLIFEEKLLNMSIYILSKSSMSFQNHDLSKTSFLKQYILKIGKVTKYLWIYL